MSRPDPSQGLLGPRPHQSYAASEASYTPTDLDRAFNTMQLNPADNMWYMDTSVTSHMANIQVLSRLMSIRVFVGMSLLGMGQEFQFMDLASLPYHWEH